MKIVDKEFENFTLHVDQSAECGIELWMEQNGIAVSTMAITAENARKLASQLLIVAEKEEPCSQSQPFPPNCS